ncbi:MFS transporter [Pelolinea submarina]|uniref:FSR family fosmidomycin resistance protein-like MFS transporter n=1 Tax=Pelolinea submarina TaxID=913107 RepID=A0A347ZRL5_9CHLR|nr:MFS transporter [Pelolinea submarina]REG11498.1 FSR family fosmidomycin resistance protein-like MFS transporter [Pelolinea submarina]BBB47946.1 MFS transporter, FSR family, fosmidomycin resistance protein [Pelolinea submarina]
MASFHSSNLQPAITDDSIPQAADEFQAFKAASVSSAHAINDTYSGFISPLLPYLIDSFALVKVQASLLPFLFQGASILQPVIGHWADRSNLRKLALYAPAVSGIFLSLLAVAPSLQTAMLYCLLAGISSAMMHAILPALVSGYSGRSTGKGMSFWLVGGELGVMLGPLIITAVIASGLLPKAPWLMLAGILISLLLNLLIKDEPYHPAAAHSRQSIPFKALAAVMLPLSAIMLMRALLRTGLEIYLPIYLSERGAGVWLSGAALSFLQAFGVLGVVLGGLANDRYGFKPVLLVSVLFSGLGMLGFVFTTGAAQALNLGLIGVSTTMMLPVCMAIAQDHFPQNRSLANGIYMASLSALNAIIGVLTGFLYDLLGGQTTYLIGGLVVFLAIPFIFMLPKLEKSPKI